MEMDFSQIVLSILENEKEVSKPLKRLALTLEWINNSLNAQISEFKEFKEKPVLYNTKLENEIKLKNSYIEKLEKDIIGSKNVFIEKLENEIKSKNSYIEKIGNEIKSKNSYIEKIGNEIKSKNSYIEKLEKDIKNKNTIITDEAISHFDTKDNETSKPQGKKYYDSRL